MPEHIGIKVQKETQFQPQNKEIIEFYKCWLTSYMEASSPAVKHGFNKLGFNKLGFNKLGLGKVR